MLQVYLKLTIFCALLSLGFSIGYWTKTPIGACPGHNNKLLSLLNLLCNSTQTTSIQTRDACYGCFFRAGNLPSGATQLNSLSQCATTYLANTPFAECSTDLSELVSGSRPTTAPTSSFCYTGYCDFVRCVRRINANFLIDGCFLENVANRNMTVQADRIYFFTNVTSCILAKTRCNAYNPISGELQNQMSSIQYGTGGSSFPGSFFNTAVLINSLQISIAGDIRIISFPGTVNIADLFCSRSTGLDQAPYKDSAC